MGYNTFVILFQSYVLPVTKYWAAVWGFNNHQAPQVLQNKISRLFLGMHRFAPAPAASLLMDLRSIQLTHCHEFIRYHNRIMNQNNNMLPRIVYDWEASHGDKGWIQDVMTITHVLHLPSLGSNILYDMENVE